MSKIIAAAFLCVFINLFSGAAEAVPVPTYEAGKHVQVVYTQDDGYRLSPVVSAGLTLLETLLAALHYPDYVVVYAPGYRPVDMPAVKEEVLSAWTGAGYNPKIGTLEVLMLAPVWVEVQLPSEFQPQKGVDYVKSLRSAGTDFTKAFGLLKEIEQAMMAKDQEVQRQKQAAADAEAARVKALKDAADVVAAAKLKKANDHYLRKVVELGGLIKAAQSCCSDSTQIPAAQKELEWKPSTDPFELYEHASDIDLVAHELRTLVEDDVAWTRRIQVSASISLLILVVLVLLLLAWSGRLKKFEDVLQPLIQRVEVRISELRRYTGETLASHQDLLEKLEYFLPRAKSHRDAIKFNRERWLFIWYPTYQMLRELTLLAMKTGEEILATPFSWPIREIQEQAQGLEVTTRHYQEVRGYTEDRFFLDVLEVYANYLRGGYAQGLEVLLRDDPKAYSAEVERREAQLSHVKEGFARLAHELLVLERLPPGKKGMLRTELNVRFITGAGRGNADQLGAALSFLAEKLSSATREQGGTRLNGG